MDARTRRRALLLTFAVFALHPLALGGWLALIPYVKATLGLNKAELAVALLGMPVATVPGLQLASRVIPRIGPRRIMAVVFPLQIVAVLLPLLAVGQLTLFLSLMAFGLATAFLQVCLNVYAGRLEKTLRVSVMNRCHGFWALGLMCGPLAMVGLDALTPLGALAWVAGMSSCIAAGVALRLPKLPAGTEAGPPPRRKITEIPPALIAISIFALAVAMTEGAMADWAAIYLAERLPAGASFAGVAVSIYAGCVALGRMTGDWVKDRIGAVAMARVTLVLAVVGLLCLILPLPLYMAYAGFALVGAGISVGFPLGISAVAALDDRFEGPNIAIMSTISISAFLVGPPLIGIVAEATSLRTAFLVLMPGLILGLWLCRWLKPAN